MPEGRSMEYAIWRCCERFHILPPRAKTSWDECDVMVQAALLSYDQVRQIEEVKLMVAMRNF